MEKNKNNEIVVSIICNTYNQEEYIADAIESFLMQKTRFAYEVLVHDDASTDNTAYIIQKYEKLYPDIIKPIYQKENQYSKGVPIGFKYQYPRIKGKYVAYCEGDDYWTDAYKLQKQVEALENHPECDICAHPAYTVNAKSKEIVGKLEPSKENRIFTLEEVINGGGGFVATNSLMLRKDNIIHPSKFYSYYRIDYALQIQGSLRGGMVYLADNMSAYRMFSKGSWSERMSKNPKQAIENYTKLIKMLEIVDEETQGKYAKTISKRIRREEFLKLQIQEDFKKILKEYKDVLKTESLKAQIKLLLKAKIPLLLRLNKWRRRNVK